MTSSLTQAQIRRPDLDSSDSALRCIFVTEMFSICSHPIGTIGSTNRFGPLCGAEQELEN